MSITTHVLDTSRGRPAGGVDVRLEFHAPEGWQLVGRDTTDGDGRARALVPPETALTVGVHRLVFDVAGYFGRTESFFSEITITFVVRDVAEHHHVPLLVSPFGYTTYRGS
jgi:5-hydroxyisourate hydrolase